MHSEQKNKLGRTALWETLTIAEWAEIMDVDRGVIEQRLMRGWSVKKTLTTPIKNYGGCLI